MFHVILHRPEIPPNTGNIIRLCANTGCRLHLVGPLGFELDRKSVQRAGMDYAEIAQVSVHADLPACLAQIGPTRLFAIETGAPTTYALARFECADALLFGSESAGLPVAVLERIEPARRLSIPMRAGNRSLNLANAVAVVVYEAWRQQGFAPSA
ncbi:MAG TPA: tRNA (cytidine(34)-2'-O)-methyltransferase [Steroidobacteraceae bacterium]|jgi:tRNA (cytidine/uridine-2'-O-)-methyltransferase|nr:tRNA (cytidine(34)-2'-O)-methyltransferase [Steroidobacteraceae bacterium]